MLGGEAANTAAHLRRWGAKCTLLGNAACANADGILLAELLNQKGLYYNIHEVRVDETPRCDIYVTPDGERTMFGIGFSRMVVPDLESFETEEGRWFTTDANLGEVAEANAQRAKSQGMTVYLMDLPPTSKCLGPGVYWQSSTRWYGERGNLELNKKLVEEVAKTGAMAILTDGENGFLVASPTTPARAYPPFPRKEAKDSTGAGDTFRAGMLFGLDQSWPLPECFAFAAAAAALAAAHIGAAEGPTREEGEALIEANPSIAATYE